MNDLCSDLACVKTCVAGSYLEMPVLKITVQVECVVTG